jgi:hypothetical protein
MNPKLKDNPDILKFLAPEGDKLLLHFQSLYRKASFENQRFAVQRLLTGQTINRI